jgi:hypothetical protein
MLYENNNGGMMEKKRSVGVTVISVIEVLLGLKWGWSSFTAFLSQTSISFIHILLLIISALPIVLGILTFQLKPIGRKLNLIFSPLIAFLLFLSFVSLFIFNPLWEFLSGIYTLLITTFLIYFFTRPKVKEQFK